MSQAVKVLAFAGARDVVGAAEVEVEVAGGCTVAALIELLCARYPGLGPHRGSLRVAVNATYAKDEEHVAPGDEVALIPPVAGG